MKRARLNKMIDADDLLQVLGICKTDEGWCAYKKKYHVLDIIRAVDEAPDVSDDDDDDEDDDDDDDDIALRAAILSAISKHLSSK